MISLWRKWNWLARRRQKEHELQEELQFHLDEEAEQRQAEGLAAEAARLAAQRDLGNTLLLREQTRDMWGWTAVEQLAQDIRFGARILWKNPGFTAVAVTMIALAIGVNATVFTVTNAVLSKGFPLVEKNDRLLYISGGGCCISYPDFEDYRAQAKSFDGMAIVHGVGIILNDTSGYPEKIEATEVSAGTFQLVGRRPVMGRDFAPSDETPGADPVAILSYEFWERRYGTESTIIGRKVRMNGAPTTVIGIMPKGFSFPQKLDVWVPLVPTPNVRKRENRETWFAFGRLAEGVTAESARAEIETIGKRLASDYPLTNRNFRPVVQTFPEFFIGPNATLIYGSMLGAVGFVLLIACANLAHLLLARAIGRSREISVRIGLGAGRGRIIRQLLIESVMLSGLGGIFGWWIAKLGVRTYELAMAYKAPWLIVDYTMDHRVLGYLIAMSIGSGILFGLAPVLQLSNLDLNATLKDGGRSASGGRRAKRLSSLLVIGEIALAVVLLAGAGVMIRSFLKIHTANMGVNTANVLIASVNLPPARYSSPEARISFFDRLQTQLESNSGGVSVAMADSLPSWSAAKRSFEPEGAPPVDELRRSALPMLTISPSYLRTMGVAVLYGRDFSDTDGVSGAPVVLVNERFASQYWPGEDPLGKRIRSIKGTTPEAWLTVVGVAPNIVQNDANRQDFGPVVYVPYRQKPGGSMWVFLRTGVRPGSLAAAVRHEVQLLDSSLPIYGPFTLNERLEVYWDSRFYGGLFLIFAAIAFLLASIGLYTVIAHSVSRRTQEIGIRIAIGATARTILKLVLVQGMIPAGIGLAVGLVASLAVNRVLKSMLVQVSPADPLTMVVVSAMLILSATLGCLIPARRAMRVNPVVALRHD